MHSRYILIIYTEMYLCIYYAQACALFTHIFTHFTIGHYYFTVIGLQS